MSKKYIHNSTLGELLKREFLEPLDLTQQELASAIGVPPNRISQIIRGERTVSAETDQLLCRYFGLTPGFFLGLQMDYDLREAQMRLAKKLERIVPLSNLQAA